MKKIYSIVLLLLAFVAVGCSEGVAEIPVKKVPLADPSILYYEGVYYAYGTMSPDGIEVLTSTDLDEWNYSPKLALHKDDSYGDFFFWAPEVYHIDGKFYMYYSAEEHICVATSDSPMGPFVQSEQKPMREEKGIDNHLFIDEDGTPYIYFCRFTNGNVIWMAELEKDLVTIKEETLVKCIEATAGWERMQAMVTEGPFVMKHNDKYYLTYSANDYQSPFYGIGYAVSDSPRGPWVKAAENPILQKPLNGRIVGTGHHAFFRDKDGKLRIAFHAHDAAGKVQPRNMYISTAEFTTDGKLAIDENYTMPHIK